MAYNYTIVETARNKTCIKFQKWRRGKKLALLFQNLLSFMHHFRRFCFGRLGLALILSNDCCFSDRNVCDVKKKQLAFPMMKFVSTVWNIFFPRIQSKNCWDPYQTAEDYTKEVSSWKYLLNIRQCVKINEIKIFTNKMMLNIWQLAITSILRIQ